MYSYIFKMFLLVTFEKLAIVLLESSLWFETAVKQFETSWRRSEEKLESQETHVVSTSIRRRLTLVNARFYDDVLGVCWSVPKIPSHTLIIFLCADSVYFILTYLLSILAGVTLLIAGFYWNRPQVFQCHRKSTF